MEFSVSTHGFTDIVNITDKVRTICARTGVQSGVAHLFVAGSTAALSTIEYESGAIADLRHALDQIAPVDGRYAHNERWGDGNGYAHLRAALMKPSLSIPIGGGELKLGTWQQIILLDFDNRPRQRTIHVQVSAAVGTARG